jgi:hypothetical protein
MPDLNGRDGFEREMARAFQKVGQRVVNELLETLGDPPNLNNLPADFWTRYGAELREAFKPTLEEIYLEAARQLLSEMPIEIEWTLPNEAAAAWAQAYSFGLVRQINQTTQAKLQQYISGYFRAQQTLGELRAAIQPSIADLMMRSGRLLTSAQRANLIAATEVTRASVQGELAIAREAAAGGMEMVAVWQTNNDDLVCPICGPRNGKEQGDGWSVPPPGHPGCRCWLNHTVKPSPQPSPSGRGS